MENHIHILHRESEEDISSFSPHSYPFSFFLTQHFTIDFFLSYNQVHRIYAHRNKKDRQVIIQTHYH